MPMILVALTLFAVVLILAQIGQRHVAAGAIAALVFALWILPGPSKVAAPLAAIFALGIGESIASLRPR